jgi:A/G-specific adenine glycosylase
MSVHSPRAQRPTARWVATTLIRWSRTHRRDFPWRHWSDPYKLLVAEILLHQTRADSVAAFLPIFLHRFPEPITLTNVNSRDLALFLRPLGFGQQRAVRLAALGARLATAPAMPTTVRELRALPGVGTYTAGMVAAITSHSRVPAVDTNVARLISRVFGLTPSHSEARKSSNIWYKAAEIARLVRDPSRIIWAMLDLADELCSAKSPMCEACPLRRQCPYHRGALKARSDRRASSARYVRLGPSE